MIRVFFGENIEEKSLTMQVKGHAGHGVIGSDIVCSAVSILTYTVAQIFKTMEQGDAFKSPAVIRLDRGDGQISALCLDSDGYAEARKAMLFAKTGFRLLEAAYPENVTLVEAEKAFK